MNSDRSNDFVIAVVPAIEDLSLSLGSRIRREVRLQDGRPVGDCQLLNGFPVSNETDRIMFGLAAPHRLGGGNAGPLVIAESPVSVCSHGAERQQLDDHQDRHEQSQEAFLSHLFISSSH